jgi:D-glycero-alpha-D-manno-heptose 1-phosphate guanylyltransferase
MAIKEAIILAGGLGTRLRSVVPNLPKCMAPVNGKPFLTYVINHLQDQGIDQFIFSLGYMSEPIVDFLQNDFPAINFRTSIEDEPLGTGGAVKKALQLAEQESVLVTNGDTLFKVQLTEVENIHVSKDADCTLSLKPMENFSRYGVVEIDEDAAIKSFKEKQFYTSGFINGGVYLLNKDKFLQKALPDKFSFETEYLEKHYKSRKVYGVEQDVYFIDIGIPADFERAQHELVIPTNVGE